MAPKKNKFEKMVRGRPAPVAQKESFENKFVNEIKHNELERLKQRVFVNSFNHIEDDVLRDKCLGISAHYRMFKDDETYYIAPELSDDERDRFKKCIGRCIQKECAVVIDEKECIPADLLKMIEFEPDMANTLKNKLNVMLSLSNKYSNSKNDINNSLFKLLDDSCVNVSEARQQSKQVDIVKTNAHMLQSNICNRHSCSDKLYESLVKYCNAKEREYAVNLQKLADLQELQNEYKQVDGEHYRGIVKRFIQIMKTIKAKQELFNSINS